MPPISIRTYFRNIFDVNSLEAAEKVYLKHASRLSLTPFSASKPLLDWLFLHGVPMAVVSNKHGDLLRKEVDVLGWGQFFYSVIGSYDTPEDKPSATPLLHALSIKKINPCPRIWFVGDSLIDMNCAKNAGCTPVSVGLQANAYEQPMIKAGCSHGLLSLLQNRKAQLKRED